MTPPRAHILLVEDDESLREVLAMNLEDVGFTIDQVESGTEAIELYDPARHELVLTDLRMPGGRGGLEVLEHVRSLDPDAVVVVLTAFGGARRSLEAMSRGAFHYVEKPINTTSLIQEIERALQHRRGTTREKKMRRAHPPSMVAASPAMNAVLKVVDKVAPSNAPVMILGESGVGKELIARALHDRSHRRTQAFVAVNCAAIPKDLLESILFGYEKGAFTGAQRRTNGKFAQAHQGTLFLDEIAEMSFELQSKLLRVLQDGFVERVGSLVPEHVDVRVITATHQDLEARVQEGRFRQDLYYRLRVIPIHVPPLRGRPEDIPVLVRHFLRQLSPDQALNVSADVDDLLMAYAWPGNVRELRNTIERMVLLRDTDQLSLSDVPSEIRGGEAMNVGEFSFELPLDGLDLMELERHIIVKALHRFGGNQSASARYLNVPRHVLVYRIEKFSIKPEEYLDSPT